MKKSRTQILVLAMCGVFVASGAIVQSAVALEKQDNKVSNTHVTSASGSQSSDNVAEVGENPSAKFNAQWSDQLVREREEAKQSKEQAQKERDHAQNELEQAKKTGSSIHGKSASGKSGSEQDNNEIDRMVQERDQYLKERDALQQETAKLRQERDRAMQAISGGSALDAVD